MKRPTAIPVIAILALIVGVVQVVASLAYLGAFGDVLSTYASWTPVSLAIGSGVVGTTLLVVSLGLILFGLGAFGLRSWAWTLGVVASVLNFVAAAYLAFAATSLTIWPVVSLLAAAVIAGYLYMGEVREAFGHEHTFFRTTSTHHPTAA
jgi:hypothetical protein